MSRPPHSVTASAFPLPSHSIRVSSRARRILLRVVPGRGLEVVLPPHADPACVPQVLQYHRKWIERSLSRIPGNPEPGLPEALLLKGGAEILHLVPAGGGPQPPLPENEGRAGPGRASRGRLPHPESAPIRRHLVLPSASTEVCLAGLKEWVREEARGYLRDLLEETARAHGFVLSGLSIRFQRSRWGSCSCKGDISLNACLLFLPERLARYIALHELCHTRQMNHSPAFWKLVFAADPDALAKDRAMREAWKYVPDWIFRMH